jgi:hypothetical protein
MGYPSHDVTWLQDCINLTKSIITSTNTCDADIFSFGIEMDKSMNNSYVWNPYQSKWDYYPTEYCEISRQFLKDVAESTGGSYTEITGD